MKTLNKIFAMAAVAATSLFTAQPAGAATTPAATPAAGAAGKLPSAKQHLTFADHYCSDWETIDSWIVNNPNRDKIVRLGIALHEGTQRKTLTSATEQQLIDDLVALGCDTPDIFWLMYHE